MDVGRKSHRTHPITHHMHPMPGTPRMAHDRRGLPTHQRPQKRMQRNAHTHRRKTNTSQGNKRSLRTTTMENELLQSRTEKLQALEAATRQLNWRQKEALKRSLIDLENLLYTAEYREETINHITAEWLREQAERETHDHQNRPGQPPDGRNPMQSSGPLLPVISRPTGRTGPKLFS